MIDCEKCVNHKICKAEEKDKVDSCAFVNYGMTKEETKIRADERANFLKEISEHERTMIDDDGKIHFVVKTVDIMRVFNKEQK